MTVGTQRKAGSLVAVVFLLATHAVYEWIFPALARRPDWVFAVGSLAAITISSLLVGLLLGKFMPSAAGSGIPQLKQAYRLDFGRLTWRGAWVKVLGGVISLGGGASLGREGPTVYASGAAASAAIIGPDSSLVASELRHVWNKLSGCQESQSCGHGASSPSCSP